MNIFLKIAQVEGRSWDLLAFVYLLSQAMPQTTRLLRPSPIGILSQGKAAKWSNWQLQEDKFQGS